MLVRWINKMKRAEAAAAAEPPEEVKLLREIRDSLKPR
jgi:large-conductance mechanosensitive channel